MKTTIVSIAMLVIMSILNTSILHADDVYLKTGFVYRNVQVQDSTSGLLHVIRDGKTISIPLSSVYKIEMITYDPNSKSKYEIFSQDMAEQYKIKMEEEEKLKAAERARGEARIEAQSPTNEPAYTRARIFSNDTTFVDGQYVLITKDSVEYYGLNSSKRYSIGLDKVSMIKDYRGNHASTWSIILGVGGIAAGTAIAFANKWTERTNHGFWYEEKTYISYIPIYIGGILGSLFGYLIGKNIEDWETVYGEEPAKKVSVNANINLDGITLSFRLKL